MAMAFAPLKKLNFSRSICATCQFNISLGKYSREVHSQNSTKLERSPSKTRELSKIEPSRSQRSQQKRLLHQFFGEHPYRINKTDASQQRLFSSSIPVSKHETITIHFIKPDGSRESVDAKVGDNLLDVVVDKDVDIDGFGACEGTLACSTCHLVFKEHDYKQIKDPLTDEELDMLDLAYGLCDTSRLGCQVIVTKEMDGWEITVPSGIEDARG